MKTASSCPHCGTGLQTCNHCETYRAYEVAKLRREKESAPVVPISPPPRSCPYCGGQKTGCYHCGVRTS